MKFKEQFDTWSYVHFLGSYALASWLFKILDWRGIAIAFFLGTLWECIDQLWSEWNVVSKPFPFWNSVFDIRGFSYVDLLFDIGGCVLFLIWSLI